MGRCQTVTSCAALLSLASSTVVCNTVVQAFIKLAGASDEDMIGSLSAIFKSKMDGKELQIDVDNMTVAHNSSQEVGCCPATGVRLDQVAA